MSYLIKERMMRDKSNQDDSVAFGDSAVAAVENVSAKKEGGTEAPLFGAKREKVEVAGYHNLPAVVANETLNIDKLPTEMLQKIFKILIELKTLEDSDQKSKLNENNQSYLNCRLVSNRWKLGMESELEKNALSIWKTMMRPVSCEGLEAEPPHLVHLSVLKPESRIDPVERAFLPPPMESWGEKGNPFPSKSLRLTSDKEDRHTPYSKSSTRGSPLIGIIPFFSKFGAHLTSLILKAVTLSAETFVGILENTQNLKALSLIKVLFIMDISDPTCAQLPSLRDLKHFRMFLTNHVKPSIKKFENTEYNFEDDDDLEIWLRQVCYYPTDFVGDYLCQSLLYDWILAPYKEQLLTLDIYGKGGIGDSGNFTNLERLFISHVDQPFFLEPNLFLYPQLKSLFLTEIQINFVEDRIEWLKRNIVPFAKTLEEIHIDFRPSNSRLLLQGVIPLFQFSRKEVPKNTGEVVFPEMKTLAIPLPKFRGEVQVIKDLIKGFPNLENLTFLIRSWEYEVEMAQEMVNQEDYGKVCPKLKKISARHL
ncbi:unnamed protein product [Orchesella dallaii]|uniref:F-box domain-containing protein n=1 Tax=Orchesella dallaii TaxID=48710 RepID=A0ABP1RJV8_9HEXA